MNYPQGKHEYSGSTINFAHFRNKTATCDKRSKYFPIVIEAVCANPMELNYGYTRLIYLEFNMASAQIRLI